MASGWNPNTAERIESDSAERQSKSTHSSESGSFSASRASSTVESCETPRLGRLTRMCSTSVLRPGLLPHLHRRVHREAAPAAVLELDLADEGGAAVGRHVAHARRQLGLPAVAAAGGLDALPAR